MQVRHQLRSCIRFDHVEAEHFGHFSRVAAQHRVTQSICVGYGVIVPVKPTLMTDFFASRHSDVYIHCEDYTSANAPAPCRDAHSDAVNWESGSAFVSNTLLSFILVSSICSSSCCSQQSQDSQSPSRTLVGCSRQHRHIAMACRLQPAQYQQRVERASLIMPAQQAWHMAHGQKIRSAWLHTSCQHKLTAHNTGIMLQGRTHNSMSPSDLSLLYHR